MSSQQIFQQLWQMRGSKKDPEILKNLQAQFPPEEKSLEAFFNNTQAAEEDLQKLKADLLSKLPQANVNVNLQIYAKLLTVAKLMYSQENNGIPEEHAYKLALLFDNEQKALDYVKYFVDKKPPSVHPMHAACNFALPQGNYDLKTWRTLFANNFKDEQFVQLILPQAAEIEELIKYSVKTPPPTIEEIKACIDEVTKLNSECKSMRRKRGEFDQEQEATYQQITIDLFNARIKLAELGMPFDNKLKLITLNAFREKYVAQSNETYKYFLEHGLTRTNYAKFIALDRHNAGTEIPDTKLDGANFGHPGFYLMKVPVQDERHAARAACLGKLTDCCQSLSGEAGEPCVVYGLTSPYSGFYVVCKGDVNNPQVEDKLVGQCWAWRSDDAAMVFDSIEVETGADQKTFDLVRNFYENLASKLVNENGIDKVACGSTSGISHLVGITSLLNKEEQFVDYAGYCDSKKQRVLQDKCRSFYRSETDIQSALTTVQDISQAMSQKEVPLVKSTYLCELINWALHSNSPKLLEEVRVVATEYGRLEELNNIIKYAIKFMTNTLTAEDLTTATANNTLIPTMINEDHQTPLMVAAQKGVVPAALKLIDLGVSVNELTKEGFSALKYAATNGHNEMVLMLIEKGALLDEKIKGRHTAIVHAITHKHSKVILTLLEKGATLNVDGYFKFVVEKGLTEVALKLIELGANINLINDESYNASYTPLMVAISNHHSELALKLIEKGAKLNLKNNREETALILALNNNLFDIAIKLIEKGANPNDQDYYGFSILMTAAQHGFTDVVLKLIENGADVNHHDRSGQTALTVALEKGHSELALKLMDLGAQANRENEKGKTALMIAEESGNHELAQKMRDKITEVSAVKDKRTKRL